MKKLIMITLFFMAASFSAFASKNSVIINASDFIKVQGFTWNTSKNALLLGPDKRMDFEVNQDILTKTFSLENNEVFVNSFPVAPNEFANISLNLSQPIVDANTEYFVYRNNKRVKGKLPQINSYFGRIEGQPNSKVILNVINGKINALIENENGQKFNIGKNFENNIANNLHSVVSDIMAKSLDESGSMMCETDFENSSQFAKIEQEIAESNSKDMSVQAMKLLQVDIAIEGNFEMIYLAARKLYGNKAIENYTEAQWQGAEDAALEYMLSVMAMSSRIYEEQLRVIYKISNIQMYNVGLGDNDPYYNLWGRDLGDKLSFMDEAWASKTNIQRTLVVLMTDTQSQPDTSIVLGIARMDNLCKNDNGFAVVGMNMAYNYPTFNFTQDVQVCVHEIGHVFGSPHTHACVWNPAIDSCVVQDPPTRIGDACMKLNSQRRTKNNGTIMSYCHYGGGIIFEFHDKVKKLIRPKAEKAQCMKEPATPTVRLISPIGREKQITGGVKFPIWWTSANVASAKLKYTTNNGTDWNDITTVDVVNDSTFNWNVPVMNASAVKIRIESLSDANVFDETVIPFAVSTKTVLIQNISENQKVGYMRPFNLSWQKVLVNSVNVFMSYDNGNEWEQLANNTSTNSLTVDFKDIATNEAILKVEDASDSKIVNQIKFNLGKEVFNFTHPLPNDSTCFNSTKFAFTWDYDFMSTSETVRIEYSTNAGADWTRIGLFHNVNTKTLKWDLAKAGLPVTDEAQFRAVLVVGTENIVISNFGGNHKLYSCVASVEDYLNTNPDFAITEVSPNPTNADVNIKLQNNYNNVINAELEISDINGNKVEFNQSMLNLTYGLNNISLNLQHLSSGTYFVSIKSGNMISRANLKITK